MENNESSNIHHILCDISKTAEIPTIMSTIFESIETQNLSSITLINNAGVISPINQIQDAPLEALSNNLDVNLKALMVLTSIFIQKTQDLQIKKMVINISSHAAIYPYEGWSVYCASKAGVDMFTKCVGLEQKRQKFPVMIMAFYPGIVDTGMQDMIRSQKKEDFPKVNDFVHYKQDGELKSPTHVAKKLLQYMQSGKLKNGGIVKIEKVVSLKNILRVLT